MTNSGERKDARDILKGSPNGYFVIVPDRQLDEGIDVAELFATAMTSWKMILGTAIIGAAVAAGISLVLRNTYRAEVVIAPVSQKGVGVGGALRSQLGGLASLAGIDLSGGGDRKEESFATLVATGFARDFISSEKLLPALFAERWDSKENHWKESEKPPTVEAAVKYFTNNVRSVSEDRKTGLIKVAVEWYSPDLAARWANRMVEVANERLRNEATRNSEQSIEYLNKELAKTNVVELRQAIYRLIEEQVSQAMLANVQREYAFRVIDPAVPPEFKFSPKRAIIVVVGALVGLVAGLMAVLLRRPRATRQEAIPAP